MDALDELIQALALGVAQRARLLVAARGVDVHVDHCEGLDRVEAGRLRGGLIKSFGGVRLWMPCERQAVTVMEPLIRNVSGVEVSSNGESCSERDALSVAPVLVSKHDG